MLLHLHRHSVGCTSIQNFAAEAQRRAAALVQHAPRIDTREAARHVIAPWVVAVCVCTARHDRERRRRRKCEHDEGAQRNQHHFVLRRSMVIAWMLPGLHPQVRNMRHTMTFPRRRMRAPGVKAQLAPPCLGDSNDPKRTAALPASASLHPADRAPSGPTHAEIYGSGRTWATPPCARAFRHPPAPRQPPAPRHRRLRCALIRTLETESGRCGVQRRGGGCAARLQHQIGRSRAQRRPPGSLNSSVRRALVGRYPGGISLV